MKKSKMILVIMLVAIISSLIVTKFIFDGIKPLEFLRDDNLQDFDQKQLEKFYTDAPELISTGEILDVKYVISREIDPYDSIFLFLFKTDQPKRINNLQISFKTEIDGKLEEHIFTKEYNDSYKLYQDIDYGNYYENPKKDVPRLLKVSIPYILESSEMEEIKSKYGENLDTNEFTFVFNFTDKSTEKHSVVADKNKMLQLIKNDLDESMQEIIENYNGKDCKIIDGFEYCTGKINKLLQNLSWKYVMYPEDGLREIYEFFDLVENSKNRKIIIENEGIINVFHSTSMKEFTSEDLEVIVDHIKRLFMNCDFNKESKGYSSFYYYLNKINERYEELTGNILVPKDFRNYEVDELFQEN